MRVLITGVSGFCGSHLAEYALSLGHEVVGTVRLRSRLDNLAPAKPNIHLEVCDLRDTSSVARVLKKHRPDWVFHLAAHSFVGNSFNEPAETLSNNVSAQLNLLEAVRGLSPDCRVMVAGSSEEYGLVLPSDCPIKETQPLRPLSPYAVSKVAQDLVGYQYHASYGMDIVRTRAFNHEGPRRGEQFALSAFAKQLAEIEAGRREPVLYVGDLTTYRDFTDVRDVVRAYWLALEQGRAGEVYNIGSGIARRMEDALTELLHLAAADIEIERDPSRLRPSDVPYLQADTTKFKALTGWEPEISFQQTLNDLWEYWQERV